VLQLDLQVAVSLQQQQQQQQVTAAATTPYNRQSWVRLLKVTCAPAGDVMLVQLLKGQPPSNATGPS